MSEDHFVVVDLGVVLADIVVFELGVDLVEW